MVRIGLNKFADAGDGPNRLVGTNLSMHGDARRCTAMVRIGLNKFVE
jgi:hypothetical protein